MNDRLTPRDGIAALDAAGKEFVELFRHGSLVVEFYRPNGVDNQKPHTRDEVYVVVSGSGYFTCGGQRRAFESGQVLFAPAGVEHQFSEFSGDFATWVFFYGPEGGERQQRASEPKIAPGELRDRFQLFIGFDRSGP